MIRSGCMTCSESAMQRRAFLRAGSLSLIGAGLPHLLRAQSMSGNPSKVRRKAEACILLWLEGGPSQIDTWDPKPSSSFKPIATKVDGIQISELLPRTARHMDKLSVIRSMHTEEVDHPEATHYAITGHRPNPAMQFPSVGSIIARETETRNGLPRYVLEPEWEVHKQYEEYFKAAFLGAEFDPMIVPDPSLPGFKIPDLSLPKPLGLDRIQDRVAFRKLIDSSFRKREELAAFSSMDTFTEQALKIVLSPSVKKAFDIFAEPDKVRDAYGRDGFGQSALLARRLVEGGCRFVTASGYKFNAWDAHAQSDKSHRDELVPPLDRTLSALLEDLQSRGLLETTVVVVMGEFGRTPHLNPNNGRDHWPGCWSLAIGGGGIQGGQVIGASDNRGAQVERDMVTIGDLFATIYKAFGIDWEKTYMTPIGRPIKIANSIEDRTGMPIAKLV